MDMKYFSWLLEQVGYIYEGQSYQSMLYFLHETSFVYVLELDRDRWFDGNHLKERFANEYGYYPDDDGCSLLEMLVAMCVREHEDVLQDGVTEWQKVLFWEIMKNLDLVNYPDDYFIQNDVYRIVVNLMNRDFSENGEGSIFHRSPSRRINYRNQPFWLQLSWFVSDNLMSQN